MTSNIIILTDINNIKSFLSNYLTPLFNITINNIVTHTIINDPKLKSITMLYTPFKVLTFHILDRSK